ncbi:hypothetical protein [Winogradskya humida]|uniref:WD40 repeat protein n=1 Tax=Winogradskya humida TaxID=113566 RepID=A0ABQ3ZMP1_9ACTN|nr:hypothetical protein [Actinoplanes humidus]GIE19769.1 hypothetical protein Ahu01nite_028710 [Actinoplanes humidus]
MDQIPNDMTALVRDVAHAAPGYAGSLDEVYRRYRRRRRSRAAVGGVLALLLIAGVGLTIDHRPQRTSRQPATQTQTETKPTAKRAQGILVHGDPRLKGGVKITGTFWDAWPDRVVTSFDIHGVTWDGAVALPGGRVVAVERGAGGHTWSLVEVDRSGTTLLRRELPASKGEPMSLLTADESTAYVWQERSLVAHDLATGTERPVLEIGTAPIQAVDYADGRLAVAGLSADCQLNFGRGKPIEALVAAMPPELKCGSVTDLRLSPDGKAIAVAYRRMDRDEQRVALLNLPAAQVLADQKVTATSADQVRLAWQDNRTLNGVVVPAGTWFSVKY